jgi:hypothetical protein
MGRTLTCRPSLVDIVVLPFKVLRGERGRAAGRRVISKLPRFFDDDERRHEIDRLLEAHDRRRAA